MFISVGSIFLTLGLLTSVIFIDVSLTIINFLSYIQYMYLFTQYY